MLESMSRQRIGALPCRCRPSLAVAAVEADPVHQRQRPLDDDVAAVAHAAAVPGGVEPELGVAHVADQPALRVRREPLALGAEPEHEVGRGVRDRRRGGSDRSLPAGVGAPGDVARGRADAGDRPRRGEVPLATRTPPVIVTVRSPLISGWAAGPTEKVEVAARDQLGGELQRELAAGEAEAGRERRSELVLVERGDQGEGVAAEGDVEPLEDRDRRPDEAGAAEVALLVERELGELRRGSGRDRRSSAAGCGPPERSSRVSPAGAAVGSGAAPCGGWVAAGGPSPAAAAGRRATRRDSRSRAARSHRPAVELGQDGVLGAVGALGASSVGGQPHRRDEPPGHAVERPCRRCRAAARSRDMPPARRLTGLPAACACTSVLPTTRPARRWSSMTKLGSLVPWRDGGGTEANLQVPDVGAAHVGRADRVHERDERLVGLPSGGLVLAAGEQLQVGRDRGPADLLLDDVVDVAAGPAVRLGPQPVDGVAAPPGPAGWRVRRGRSTEVKALAIAAVLVNPNLLSQTDL